MSFLFWFAVALACWFAVSVLVGWLVGSMFAVGARLDEPERDWQWPPRVIARLDDRCVCGGERRFCGRYFVPAREIGRRK